MPGPTQVRDALQERLLLKMNELVEMCALHARLYTTVGQSHPLYLFTMRKRCSLQAYRRMTRSRLGYSALQPNIKGGSSGVRTEQIEIPGDEALQLTRQAEQAIVLLGFAMPSIHTSVSWGCANAPYSRTPQPKNAAGRGCAKVSVPTEISTVKRTARNGA